MDERGIIESIIASTQPGGVVDKRRTLYPVAPPRLRDSEFFVHGMPNDQREADIRDTIARDQLEQGVDDPNYNMSAPGKSLEAAMAEALRPELRQFRRPKFDRNYYYGF